MKAAIIKSNSIIEIKNLEKSPLGPREILVKMQACGICGSDVKLPITYHSAFLFYQALHHPHFSRI